MMAGDVSATAFSNWHNESNPSDVNGDGAVTAVDALITINALSRFDEVMVGDIQDGLHAVDSSADELYGGYHPDVDLSGTITALDALRIINQLIRFSSTDSDNPVSVIPDAQGRPLRVIFTAADGRTKEVDVSELDVAINWSQRDVIVTDTSDEIVVIARPGVGVLEVDGTVEDGLAVVTRYGSDGAQVTERYVCFPDTIWTPGGGIVLPFEPNDVRRPIIGFEEVLGAMVEQHTVRTAGYEIVLRYEEAAAPNLISITATLPSGESMTVNTEDATLDPQTIIVGTAEWGPITKDLESFEADMIYLLQLGYQPFETVTPSEVLAAVEEAQSS